MIKKFVYYGLALILIAIILALASGYLLNSKVGSSVSSANLTAGAGGFAYISTPVGNYTALAVYAIMSNSTNLYIMNGSTFAKWNSYISANKGSSGISYAQSLGVNSSYIFKDKRSIYTQLFISGNTANSSTNKAYVVMDNTPGSNSTAIAVNGIITYIPVKLSSILVYEVPVIIALILGVSGLIIIIYGLVRKGQPKLGALDSQGISKEQKDKEYLDQVYKGVDSKKRKKNKPSS